MTEFRALLKTSLEREAEAENNNKLIDAVYEKLDSQVPEFEMPEAFLQSEAARELRKIADSTVKSEADAEEFKKNAETHRAAAEQAARKSLRRSLILRKIARDEKITVTAPEVEEQVKGMSRYYGYQEKEFRAMLEKTGGIEELQLNILNAKVLSFLADNVKK